ncbi:MAG: hypothetical protein RIS94_3295 [Pseudomonadota bacterium]
MLTGCLALVRPVGMSEEAAEEWISLATDEVQHVPADLLDEGCAMARRKCRHHGAIVPTIMDHAEERWAARKRMRFALLERAGEAKPKREAWKPTAEELEMIKRQATDRLRAGRD